MAVGGALRPLKVGVAMSRVKLGEEVKGEKMGTSYSVGNPAGETTTCFDYSRSLRPRSIHYNSHPPPLYTKP